MTTEEPSSGPSMSTASFSCHMTAYGITGMASRASTRRPTGMRRQAAATATRTPAISRSAGRPATPPLKLGRGGGGGGSGGVAEPGAGADAEATQDERPHGDQRRPPPGQHVQAAGRAGRQQQR